MATRYEAFDAAGKRHTRKTEGRKYMHCVVFHIPSYTSTYEHIGWVPAHDKTSWAGSHALAEKAARSHWAARDSSTTVEIIEAQVVEGKR